MAASGSSDLGAAARVLGFICVASSVSVRLGCRLIDVLFQPSSSSFSSSSSSASDEAGLLDASPAQVAAEALVSFFLIDLISGIFHVALDHADPGPLLRHVVRTSRDAVHETRSADWRYGASSAWRQVVWNFQSHHCAPFPEHDDQLVETAVVATPLLVATLAQYALGLGHLPASHCRVWCCTLLLGHLVQVVHFAAHARVHLGEARLPRWLVWLQDARVLLSPAVHRKHHETFDCNFCIFNGWANPLVDAALQLALWARLVPSPEARLQVKAEGRRAE